MNILNILKDYWKWILLVLIILIIFIRAKKRKYFWKVRKTGEELKFRDFLKRWKKGVEGITNLQKVKSEITGVFITMFGLVSGIVTMSIVRPKDMWWWIVISLSGGLILTLMNQVGNFQKYFRFKKIEDEIKKLNNDNKDRQNKKTKKE